MDLATLPVFVRAGAILPMYPSMLFDSEKPLDEVTFDLYPQGESQYTLYEDDGNTRRYQQGESSTQVIRVQAPVQGSGPVQVQIDPVQGQYNGQLAQRRYGLRVLSRQAPRAVHAGGRTLPALADAAAFNGAAEGWYFDAKERRGTLHVRTATQDIRQPLQLQLDFEVAAAAADDAYPAAPVLAANCRPTACWWSIARPKSPAMRWKMPSMMTRPPGSAVCATSRAHRCA